MAKDTEYLYKNCFICSDHFKSHFFLNDLKNRLHSNAIPTIFDVPNPPKLVASKRRRLNRSECASNLSSDNNNKKNELDEVISDHEEIMKVAVVSGGAKGIGRAVCEILAKNNYKVILIDIDSENGNIASAELQSLYGKENFMFLNCDVSSFDQFKKSMEKVIQVYQHIDVVINNAGILNENNWQKMINTNLTGTIHGTLLGLQFMGKDKGNIGGTIINISSNAALQPFPLAPIYSACKHGILGLSSSYGHPIHFERTGVCVLTLCPSPTNTKLNKNFVCNSALPDVAKKHMDNIEMIEPSVVAEALFQMLNEQKTGSVMEVNLKGYQYINYY